MLRAGLLSAGLLLATALATAEPLLFVAPLRVEFGPLDTTAVVTVTNQSDRVKRYEATLIDQVMNANGVTEQADDFAFSAKKMLRFMPRKVELQPGQRQVVRVMVKRPAELADGDYHTHLIFEEDKAFEQQRAEKEAAKNPENKLKLRVDAQYSVAIPVVVQHGDVSSSMVLHGISYSPRSDAGPEGLIVRVSRLGNAGVDGYLTIKAGGEDVVQPRRLRLYREQDEFAILLPLKDKAVVRGKPLTVVLATSFAKDATVLKQMEITLP